ncbi:MAG TPA: hypothetical protein VFY29_08255 [Terriglobia bacterium]|nr:hypothetical protein [Terriglobia bacterium]
MKSRIGAVVAVFVLCGVCAGAPPQGRGKGGRGAGRDQGASSKQVEIQAGVVFTNSEVRIIREWFSNKRNLSGLPPGLAKKEKLPPGLEKQLQRNGSLPPGLEKKVQPLPRDLEARLPRLPDGRRRIIISGSVILTDKGSNKILDIVANVL